MSVMETHHRWAGQSPVLLSEASQSGAFCGALLDAITEPGDSKLPLAEIRNAVEKNGAKFLFEIPGHLFEEDDSQAFVIFRPQSDGGKHSFVVYNPESGTIRMLDHCDVPYKAQCFFGSYASVLACLSKISTVRH